MGSESDSTSQQFGDYHLLHKIATGGMAEVWKARAYGMAGFEKTLVIKRVLDDLARDEEFRQLFIDEARIAVALQHHNIVQVFDLGEVDGAFYMVMEFVNGYDLSQLLSRTRNLGHFPIPLALFVITEVLKALQFAHERSDDDGKPLGIVHCDISPHNILLSNSGEVKITDFGISRVAFQSKNLQAVLRGKYAYMSPEQVDGAPLDCRSDLFSLGIVLWEMVSGRRLFKAKAREETLNRVRRADVPSPRTFRPEVSEALEGILLRALARNPAHRYGSAGEMLDALGLLMVREGHRPTNHSLAACVKRASVSESTRVPEVKGRRNRVDQQQELVVLSAEIRHKDPARIERLLQAWAELIDAQHGELWERNGASLVAVFRCGGQRTKVIQSALDTTVVMRKIAEKHKLKVAVGVAPGAARVYADTLRPPDGWEIAGPFYLARWMMNLSAHRGRSIITHVMASKASDAHRCRSLGRITVSGDQYIYLYELH